jgi:hypothetical protein
VKRKIFSGGRIMMRNSISYRVGNEDEEKQGPKRQEQLELQVKSGVRRDHGEQISGKISQGV